MHTRDPVNLNAYISVRNMMQHVAPVHIRTTLVSGTTIIEQFLFIDISTFAMICLIPGSDGLHV